MPRSRCQHLLRALVCLCWAALAPSAPAQAADPEVLRQFDFAAADADTDGWAMGWNKNDALVIDDVDVEAGVGLKLSMKAAASSWSDANIKLSNLTAPYPSAVKLRVLVPASAGRIRSLQFGCALNSPWSESKAWIDFKPTDKLSIKGTEYNVQDVLCKLGPSDPKQNELILRFGGDRVRYQGPLYLQKVQLLQGL
jgi:hypothetical protein